MYNVIVTKIALTKSTLSAQNSLNVGCRPGMLRSLSAPPDSLTLAGRRCGNKKQGKEGRRKARKRRESEAAHPRRFL